MVIAGAVVVKHVLLPVRANLILRIRRRQVLLPIAAARLIVLIPPRIGPFLLARTIAVKMKVLLSVPRVRVRRPTKLSQGQMGKVGVVPPALMPIMPHPLLAILATKVRLRIGVALFVIVGIAPASDRLQPFPIMPPPFRCVAGGPLLLRTTVALVLMVLPRLVTFIIHKWVLPLLQTPQIDGSEKTPFRTPRVGVFLL